VSSYRRKVPIPCSVHRCPNHALPGLSRCETHEQAFEAQRRLDPTVTGRRGTDAAWARARGLALYRFGYRCADCHRHKDDLDKSLEVHHVDGDPTNHRQGNLRVLCPDCHRLAP
jgi:5-methylcytosine-specific restriction endonuclease McrA